MNKLLKVILTFMIIGGLTPNNAWAAVPLSSGDTRPAVVGGFLAGIHMMSPGQIGVNVENFKFDVEINSHKIDTVSVNTYDLFGALSSKCVVGLGVSGGKVIDTYGKYTIDRKNEVLFGTKWDAHKLDAYYQYKLDPNVNMFMGTYTTSSLATSPFSSSKTYRQELSYGISAFTALSPRVGIHGMISRTAISGEWNVGLGYRMDRNSCATIQYRDYKQHESDAPNLRVKGISVGINYLF